MCLHPQNVAPVPEATARIARAACRKGTVFLRMRDELGTIYTDGAFASLFPTRGQATESPWRLALVTLMQYVEGLSDVQAADAVRGYIDWKYTLSLELDDPGFDASVLSEFRTRLLEGGAEEGLVTLMLDAFGERRPRSGSWPTADRFDACSGRHPGYQSAAVRWRDHAPRTQCAGRRRTRVAPDTQPAGLGGALRSTTRRCSPTAGKQERTALAEMIGTDGRILLSAVDDPASPAWLRELPAVQTLRRVWIQQFYVEDDALRWRTEREGIPPAARFISSPYDLDAHLGKKGMTAWIGYKVHLTETCDEDLPRLITNLETSSGPTADGAVTPTIHDGLKERALLPELHIVDTGYLDAEVLVPSRQDFNVDLLGPTRHDRRWQSRAAAGFGMADFTVDSDRQKAVCPEGHESVEWMPRIDNRGNDSIYIRFSPSHCAPCASRAMCTRSAGDSARRSISVRPEAQYAALRAARAREQTEALKEEYARRAGIEGTLSQGIRALGLRRSRYIGKARTHLQHVLIAAATNFVRVDHWLAGVPIAQTRRSPFVALIKPFDGIVQGMSLPARTRRGR